LREEGDEFALPGFRWFAADGDGMSFASVDFDFAYCDLWISGGAGTVDGDVHAPTQAQP